ncbi:unnamed protein product [Nezara viridula]|uniref:Peptidase S1 domain-containing protein n=1 Tax=Nezara viridula TaxID=85310 RepID=A0A9P0HFM3_NEZVI|nr:unnamed protein product [Nezara viridula]
MRSVLYSIILSILVILSLVLIFYFTFGGAQAEEHLKLNATCKNENLIGICKSKDSCHSSLPGVKLESCNGDSSLVCCPLEEITISKGHKRTPGEKAKEMCKIYGETAYKYVPSNDLFNTKPIKSKLCDGGVPLVKGGENASENEFPHMARIGIFNSDLGNVEWRCGGSIVSPKFILSAAHCPVTEKNGFAMFGTIQTYDILENHTVSIMKVHIHPHYNAAENKHDIALFELEIPLNTSERPICLDTGSSIYNDMIVTATGFGLNKDQEIKVLQKVDLNIVDESSCANKYKQSIKDIEIPFPEHPLCAYQEGKDTCKVCYYLRYWGCQE